MDATVAAVSLHERLKYLSLLKLVNIDFNQSAIEEEVTGGCGFLIPISWSCLLTSLTRTKFTGQE